MKFILANQSHDAQLRAIINSETMPGNIQVCYEREPDFFHGLGIQGDLNQVMAAEENGIIIGFGCRSVRPMYINGRQTDFGYLSGLRSSSLAKSRMGLARGYRMLSQLHKDERCAGYITTIISGNLEAFSTIAQGRAGLPFYKDMGKCHTYAIALSNRRKKRVLTSVSIRFAQEGEEAKVISLLKEFGRQYQFFPALAESDFGTPLLRNLPVTQFIIAEQNGTSCGVAAIWDQSSFKQYRINKYSRILKLTRPFINIGLKLAGYSSLPQEGQILHNAFLCFKAAKDNSPEILSALLQFACDNIQQAGFSHCILGFHEDDSAKTITAPYQVTVYQSRLYFAGWEKELETYHQLDQRITNFEPAIL